MSQFLQAWQVYTAAMIYSLHSFVVGVAFVFSRLHQIVIFYFQLIKDHLRTDVSMD